MFRLAPIWAMVLGLALFMVFYTIIEMTAAPANLQIFLTVVWAGVGLFSAIEMMGEFKESRKKPDPFEAFKNFHTSTRKRNARRRRNRIL